MVGWLLKNLAIVKKHSALPIMVHELIWLSHVHVCSNWAESGSSPDVYLHFLFSYLIATITPYLIFRGLPTDKQTDKQTHRQTFQLTDSAMG